MGSELLSMPRSELLFAQVQNEAENLVPQIIKFTNEKASSLSSLF